eukprot:2222365-Pleurochrysis_carterae.AAC.2
MVPSCSYTPLGPHILIFASKLQTQLAISRRPSDIAIEFYYLAFRPRTRILTFLTLARRTILAIVVARPSAWLACTVSHFCIGIACVRAERSRSASGFLVTARTADLALPRPRIEAAACAQPRACAAPFDLDC